jgi:oxygen-independent coproporphyrinogen-3 oxidase
LALLSKSSPPGLYVHIPFCISKCGYCDFYSESISEFTAHEAYIDALVSEIKLLNIYPKVSTAYIGGGNPSILNAGFLEKLFKALADNFKTNTCDEFTIEANPETLDEDFIKVCLSGGVNRISLGVQSFNHDTLATLRRNCKKDSVFDALELIKKHGLVLSLDLMFAVPNQRVEDLLSDLQTALKFSPEHISLYTLMYSKSTLITKLRDEGSFKEADDDTVLEMFYKSGEYLEKNGYAQYEVSNFAKDGYYCRHNMNYWELLEYVAFGASASGYVEGERYTNISDYKKYINIIKSGKLPREFNEILSPEDKWLEYVMLSLRLKKGLNINMLKVLSVNDELIINYKNLVNKLSGFVNEGYIIKNGNNYSFSKKGLIILDEITNRLI